MAKNLMATPKGTARYPHLNKPDVFKDGPPTFKVDLLCDPNEASSLTAKLEDILEDYYQDILEKEGEGKYDEIFKEELPFYLEDGQMLFRTKVKQQGGNGKETWPNKVNFFDAGRNFIPEAKRPIVGGGSIIKVQFEPFCWSMPGAEGRGANKKSFLKVGISLRLKGIQIFEIQQGGGTANAGGFEAEEGGYTYDPEAFDGDTPEMTEGDF